MSSPATLPPGEEETITDRSLRESQNKVIAAVAELEAQVITLSKCAENQNVQKKTPFSLRKCIEKTKKKMDKVHDILRMYTEAAGLKVVKTDLVPFSSSTLEILNLDMGFTEGDTILFNIKAIQILSLDNGEPSPCYVEYDRRIKVYGVSHKEVKSKERVLALCYEALANTPTYYNRNQTNIALLSNEYTMPEAHYPTMDDGTIAISGVVDIAILVAPRNTPLSDVDLNSQKILSKLTQGGLTTKLKRDSSGGGFQSKHVAQAVCEALAAHKLHSSLRFFLSDGEIYQFGLIDVSNKTYHLSNTLNIGMENGARIVLTVLNE